MSKHLLYTIFKIIVILLGILLSFELLSNLVVQGLWFQEVGYLNTFLKRLFWQLGLFGITTSFSIWFLLNNLRQANRYQWDYVPETPSKRTKRRERLKAKSKTLPESHSFGLFLLLSLILGLGILTGLMLLYCGQVAYDVWTPDLTLPDVRPPLPRPFFLNSLPELINQISQNLGKIGLIGVLLSLILINSQLGLKIIAILFSVVFGLVISGNWTRILQNFNATSFGKIDPEFHHDISFYIFKLPSWKLLDFWLGGLFLYGLISVSLTYLLSAKSLSQGKFPGFSRQQLCHLYVLGGLSMTVMAQRHWLSRYQLLYSPRGIAYGASYTDIHVQLPALTLLSLVASGIAIWLLFKGITAWGKPTIIRSLHSKPLPHFPFSPLPFAIYLLILIVALVGSEIVQTLIVEPNELARERPYIERTIALTRAAFNLNKIEFDTLDAQGRLTAKALEKNHLTINNIRLWDARPLLQTNRQLQQIRLYYKFLDADIDRYTLPVGDENPLIRNAKKQVLIAARELDYTQVPQQAKTWVNQHLVYTHGYGFTLSPVNRADEGGLPYYFVKNIGTANAAGELQTSSEGIRANIPIENPRLYFGELTNTYIMTNTKVKEFDFPSGEDNVYNIYSGRGGIQIGSPFKRLIFAIYLKDWQMLFTDNFTSQTRLLFRRNINHRIREIAPFLQFDKDPYLVTAKVNNSDNSASESPLYWMIDAYTTTDSYPYSDPGNRNFNYIRNSVKIVINAYNGEVNFYVVDPNDPLIQTWTKVFPKLFKSFGDMPMSIKAHIRYPKDLFSTQSERLLTYHMIDPQVFYNREDQWRIPQEIYGEKQQPIEPYYLLMGVTGDSQEFILVHFFTPTSRNNLIAGFFARSDGNNYGKMRLIQLPKERVIYGPEQVEALINQDPVISQQISLWNRQGSKVIQGNLLVIPFFSEQSLLYVEPLYLEAEQNSLPTLVRVIVVYENKIIMADTLNHALKSIFKSDELPS
ncbi:UPF0182 family protein [Aphanothece sacrum]|uniref:UPF0182 protein AsFPU1_1862 n=1 Tax=Aphanothece sacrum FPU1 TaxID=1920663 RepID=A0A401IGW8_APHSA|nr:UPF0182 family protein [Aphanothece sacrum]GBF80461.1 membrane protein [Aphanothece sacrum FPU1]GBF85542.1 membrane protein [Aphanothece sacrum FPU3]